MSAPTKSSKNIPRPTHFGKNLKFLRRMQGLSQTELAKQLGMSRNNIASYESGLVEPNMKKFLVTCEFFNIEPNEMLESVLSKHPTDITNTIDEPELIVDKYLSDQMEQFVIQTNEMTKVFEGYQALFEMKKESDEYQSNKEFYATFEDLLDLLKSLIGSNWKLIQSVYPVDIESDDNP